MSLSDSEVYQFRPNPGPRERHLKRQHRNPLFERESVVTQREVNEARQADLDELESFTNSLRALVQEAVDLPANAESDVVLGLKETADKLYEQAAGLGGQLDSEMEAIRKLTSVIMAAVRRGAGVDPTALNELEQEELARTAHYGLLKHPLVADLLNPDSPISAEQLVPTLLSADAAELEAALGLFQPAQALEILQQAEALAGRMESGAPYEPALVLMRARAAAPA